MAQNQIVVKIDLDNHKFKVGMEQSNRAVQEFESSVSKIKRPMRDAEQAHHHWANTLKNFVIVLGLSRHALLNLEAITTALPRKILAANGEIERMTALMQGLSTTTEGTAAAQKEASDAMAKIFDIAKKSPFDVNAIADSFVKLKSGGLDPLDGSLQALVDSVAKFGGTPEVMKRAAIAIQQMAGKGVISMEELRQQLGEAVPNSMQIMARALGLSVGELAKRVSTGTVAAKQALEQMFKQMRIENSGAAEFMSETWGGLLSRIRTQLMETSKTIGDAGFFDAAKDALRDISTLLDSGGFKSAMETVGELLTLTIAGIKAAISAFAQWGSGIAAVTGFIIASRIAQAASNAVMGENVKSLRAAASSYSVLTAASEGYNASLRRQAASIAATKAAAAAGAANNLDRSNLSIYTEFAKIRDANTQVSTFQAGLVGAASAATTAMKGLGAAIRGVGSALLALAGGWVGAAITAIGALVYQFWSAGEEADKLREKLQAKNFTAIDQEDIENINKYKQRVAELSKEKERNIKLLEQEKALVASGQGDGGSAIRIEKYTNAIETTGRALKELNDQIGGMGDVADEALKHFANEERIKQVAEQSSNAVKAVFNEMAKGTQAMVVDVTAAASKILEAEGQGSTRDAAVGKVQELYKGLMEARVKYFDDAIKELETYNQKYNKVEDEEKKKQIAINLKALEELRRLKKEEENLYFDRMEVVQNQTKKSPAEQFLDRIKKTAANLDANAKEVHPLTEQFALMKGELKPTADELAKINAELEKLNDLNLVVKDQKAETARLSEMADRLKGMAASVKNAFDTVADSNPFMKHSQRAQEYITKLEAMKAEINEMNHDGFMGGSSAEGVARLAEIDEQIMKAEELGAAYTAFDYRKQARDINRGLLPAKKALEKSHELEIAQLEAVKEKYKDNAEVVAAATELMQAKQAKFARDSEKPIQTLARNWADMTTAMDNLWADTMEKFVDTLADGIMEGKFQFDDFAKYFAASLIKMQLQASAAQIMGQDVTGANPLAAIANGISGFLGFANGGIMTSRGAMQLNKYANGGIADRPQLALFGEGRQPEAYVPLPDGRTIPVTVKGGNQGQSAPSLTVNLFNESGQPVEAESNGGRFEADQWVYDVVLRGLSRPGGFRDGVKGALRK